ncbi:GGDEF domain-containing protein [Vibrio atlanticus]|uniref:GGDEF domain-containing protein n=1 Tax=Vibrio atlanticus TaxID=693153 RepID=UPI0022B02BC5|nr:GGDEF domain-containing protein [Vibrio atlanticus]MCZ4308136.1 GGDEF domain-containing protein [Vibrio atlanticus]
MANVHPRLIKNVVEQTPRAMIAMLIVSSAYGAMFFEFIPMGILCIWFLGQALLAWARLYNAKQFTIHLNCFNQKGLNRNERMFVILNVFQAITWTISSLLIMKYAPQPFEFVSFVLIIGIITAAALSMSSLYRAYLVFFFSMLIPQIIIMLYYGEHQHISLVIFTIIYIPATILLSKSMLNNRMSSILAHEEIERSAEAFKQLSTVDNLTNIYNRRYFFEMSQSLLLMAEREKNSVSMLMIDVDNFKTINDNYGHQAGDYVLTCLAKDIECLMRKSDLFARIGGEEFAILLDNTSFQDAKNIAGRIIKTVETSAVIYNQKSIDVTVSIGLSALNSDMTDIEELYVCADKHLYQAKARGRNQYYPSL